MVNVELSNIWSCISLPQLLGAEKALYDAHLHLSAHQKIGGDFLDWLSMPDAVTAKTICAIRNAADAICSAGDTLVVTGCGGAYLGAKAGVELLGKQDRMLRGTRVLFAGDDVSAKSWLSLSETLSGCDFSLFIIAGNETDLPSAIASRALRWMMERRYGAEAKTHIYVSAPAESAAAMMAKEEGYTLLAMPAQLGGCDSALTPAALTPLAVSGVNPLTVFEGAAEALKTFDLRAFENPVWMYAGARHVLTNEAQRKMELLSTFDPALCAFGDWWKQGTLRHTCQNGLGALAMHLSMPHDLPAIDQALASGRYPVFETMLRAPLFAPQRVGVEMDWKDYDGLGYLSEATLPQIEQALFDAMLQQHAEADVPVIVLETDLVDAAVLGELFCFFELANAICACADGLDPFARQNAYPTQRAAEALLGKPENTAPERKFTEL